MSYAVWSPSSSPPGCSPPTGGRCGTSGTTSSGWPSRPRWSACSTVALLAGATDSTAGRWLALALVLGLVGDVLLLEDTPSRFVGGLAAFLVGHLAYVASFVAVGLDRPALGWVGALVLLVALLVGRRILPGAVADGGVVLGIAVGAYMAVIGAMAVTGWATGRPLVGLGASLFVVSDTVLAMGRSCRPGAGPRWWSW